MMKKFVLAFNYFIVLFLLVSVNALELEIALIGKYKLET